MMSPAAKLSCPVSAAPTAYRASTQRAILVRAAPHAAQAARPTCILWMRARAQRACTVLNERTNKAWPVEGRLRSGDKLNSATRSKIAAARRYIRQHSRSGVWATHTQHIRRTPHSRPQPRASFSHQPPHPPRPPAPKPPTSLLPGQREARSATRTHLEPFSKPIFERPEPPSPDMEPPVAAAIPEPAPMPSSALPFCAWLGLGLGLGSGLGLGLAGY